MRSSDIQQLGMFSYVSVESRVPQDHPIRKLRLLVNFILKEMDADFAALYSDVGRPSIPPERLLRASLLQLIYSIRSERQLMERLDYDLLFRWFVGLNIDDPVWDHSTFSFNRDRLFNEEITATFFQQTVLLAEIQNLVSDDHFSVDGTLLKAWASHKSFRRKDGSDDHDPGQGSDFRGQSRSNETHASTTDPDARLARKGAGKEAKLCHLASVLMENRNGLIVGVDVRHATGTGEREGALDLLNAAGIGRGATLGADKGYDTEEFVAALEARGIAPHIARNTSGRNSAVSDTVANTTGYAISQQVRKRIEQPFGWGKVIGGLCQLPLVGLVKARAWTTLTFAAYNLIRLGGIGGWWESAPT
jgi:transposase